MKSIQLILAFFFVFILLNSSCKPSPKQKEFPKNIYTKPAAIIQDTLIIYVPAAVFYHPDSIQLLQIKAATNDRSFEGAMHEFYSQMKNAHTVLNSNWQQVNIIEAKNVRYLLFKKKNQDQVFVDLNTKGDPYGLFLFNTVKDPQLADMMNIDTQLYFYFSK